MSAAAAVGVNNNLATGQAGIAVGAANHKLACGVHVHGEGSVEQFLNAGRQFGHGARNQNVFHILLDFGKHRLVGVELVVLCRNNDCINTFRLVVVIVLNCHLAFCVGAQIGHHLAFAADGGQLNEQAVSKFERQRHIVVGL